MAQPKVIILRAPGTNCDQETGYAFTTAGAVVDYVHINQLIQSPGILADYQILCLPGGFSYGDDIAAGRVLASQMQSTLAAAIGEFHAAGKLVLGICNGFQILIKTGFLLPADDGGLPATLTWNNHGRFIDCWVNLKTENQKCVFLKDVDQMYLPIAHAEGQFVARDETVMDGLKSNHQLALTYCRPDGTNGSDLAFPENPNGSKMNVAGVCDQSGRIFGLMPHPERYIDPTHHPRWTREGTDKPADGLAVFKNAVDFFG